jgi:hypothetical protein
MHPVFGLPFMIFIWLVQLVTAYLVYKDAKEQKMSALLWFILVIIPMFGFLCGNDFCSHMCVQDAHRNPEKAS